MLAAAPVGAPALLRADDELVEACTCAQMFGAVAVYVRAPDPDRPVARMLSAEALERALSGYPQHQPVCVGGGHRPVHDLTVESPSDL